MSRTLNKELFFSMTYDFLNLFLVQQNNKSPIQLNLTGMGLLFLEGMYVSKEKSPYIHLCFQIVHMNSYWIIQATFSLI